MGSGKGWRDDSVLSSALYTKLALGLVEMWMDGDNTVASGRNVAEGLWLLERHWGYQLIIHHTSYKGILEL